MEFKYGNYIGQGINHDKEEFRGEFQVQSLPKANSKSIRYLAIRVSDNTKVHEEIGLLTENEDGVLELHVHMEEMPCVTIHTLKEKTASRWVFEYEGKGKIAGFSSELVFEFEGDKFRYLHRWAMGGEISDKSWCLLEPINNTL